MINVLICNGSIEESQDFRNNILKCCGNRVNGIIIFEECETFLFYLEEHKTDANIIIFELGFCKGGLKIADKAKELNPWSEIIFISHKGKWSLDVYDVEHVYGLEYPFTEEKLEIGLKKALDKIDENGRVLFPVKKKGAIQAVPLKEIQYLEQDKRRIIFHMEDEAHSLYLKFSDLEKYKKDYFTRCHNSYAVNFFYVKMMTERHFIMKNGTKFPISRSRKFESKEAYEAFITRRPILIST